MDSPVHRPHLKRLELQGFKTFANRTAFDFSPGITAIVGPNGSGKSNVADALRWVLGEAASRLLRVRRTEEVIFAGNPQKAPAATAEVSLTIDNDGWLPLESAPVTITRRAHRPADGEIFINSRRARLRDLQELLSQASGSFLILGQGLVDGFLAQNPQERRALIEEAIGLQRYRLSLEETQEKLAAAQENRGQLELLLAELTPRLAQLERQARRARERARLGQELSQAQGAYYVARRQTLQGEIAAAELGYKDRHGEHMRALSALQSGEEALASLKEGLIRGRAELEQERRQAQALAEEVRRRSQETALARQRREGLALRSRELLEEAQALQREAGALAATSASEEERLQALLTEMGKLQEGLAQGRPKLASVEEEIARLRPRVAAIEKEVLRDQADMLQVEARLKRLAEARGRLQRQSEAPPGPLAELVDLARKLRSAKDGEAAGGSEFQELARRCEEAKERVRQGREALAALEGEMAASQREEEALERHMALLVGDGSGGPLPGTLLPSVLRVDPGLERAITAALAYNLQGRIVESFWQAVEALAQGDPALFFPLEMLRTPDTLRAPFSHGVLGIAANMVYCSEAYRPLVQALLGRTLVVEDLGSALALWPQEAFKGGFSIVTRDGLLLQPWGAVGLPASREADLFALKRRAQELAQSRGEVEGKLMAGRLACKAEEENLARIEKDTAIARRLWDEKRTDLSRLQTALAAHRHQVRRLATERRQARWEMAALAQEEAQLEGERQRLEPSLTEAEGLQRDQEALAALQRRREELHSALARDGAKAATLEAEVQATVDLPHRRQESAARLQARAAQQHQQAQALAQEEIALGQSLLAQEAELQAHKEGLSAISRSLEEARREVAAQEAREERERREMAAAQTRLREAERRLWEAEAVLKRLREALAALEEETQAEGIAAPVAIEPGDPALLARRVAEIKGRLASLPTVSPEVEAEYQEVKERHDFLATQREDLMGAEEALKGALARLRGELRRRFREALADVGARFQERFASFFGGGRARLLLTGDDEEAGVEIVAHPPGKSRQNLHLLSSGEKALTAVAFLFALLGAGPAPFCLLDEVDASLDEANVGRFVAALKELSQQTQFLVITHNRRTMEAADTIYGVTLGPEGSSRVLSLRLDEIA